MENLNNQTTNEAKLTETKKTKAPTKQQIYLFAISMLFIGLLAICAFWDFGYADKILFGLAIKNGINPTILVLFFSAILLGFSIYFFRLKKQQKLLPIYLIPAFLFLSLGLSNVGKWIARDCQIDIRYFESDQIEEYLKITKENEGFSYICEVTGEKKVDDETKTRKYYLFVKVIEGKKYYYCTSIDYFGVVSYIVEKYNNRRGIISNGYIIDFDFDWANIYVLNKDMKNSTPSQKTLSMANSGNNSYSNSDQSQTIFVEHQRQSMPVQEWVVCGTCRGSRDCQTCGGKGWTYSASSPNGEAECYNCRGRKDCPACGGRGGQYQTVYR